MKHETVRASAFAMPLTNPAFPSSPYRFVNREYFRAAQRGISQKEATEELLAEKQPSLDFASSAQLGGTVAFLCSSAADQITGTAISVDGGWTAQ